MLCVHDLHFVLEVQDVSRMVADTKALEVLKHLPRCHPCVTGNWLVQLGIPRLVNASMMKLRASISAALNASQLVMRA